MKKKKESETEREKRIDGTRKNIFHEQMQLNTFRMAVSSLCMSFEGSEKFSTRLCMQLAPLACVLHSGAALAEKWHGFTDNFLSSGTHAYILSICSHHTLGCSVDVSRTDIAS